MVQARSVELCAGLTSHSQRGEAPAATKQRMEDCAAAVASDRQTELFKYLMTRLRINTDEKMKEENPSRCLPSATPHSFTASAHGQKGSGSRKKDNHRVPPLASSIAITVISSPL